MERLIGILSDDRLMVYSNGKVSILDSSHSDRFKSYKWLKNFDINYNKDLLTKEVFNFRMGPVTGASSECGTYHLLTYGERMVDAGIDYSFKERGIIEKIIKKSPFEVLHVIESICANFTISHLTAFCNAVEKGYNINIPSEVEIYRKILLEVERIYNHLYVIAKLAQGAAQKVYFAHLMYIFDEILSLNKIYFDNRFLKGCLKPGWVKIIPLNQLKNYIQEINKLIDEFDTIFFFSLESRNYLDRLHLTGILTYEDFENIGFDGPALKAIGHSLDLREFSEEDFNSITYEGGDSLARMMVRGKEIFQSVELLNIYLDILEKNYPENIEAQVSHIPDNKVSIGMSESPSGLICYYLEFKDDKIKEIYISSPSLFLFKAIQKSLIGQIFTDFCFTVDSYGAFFADCIYRRNS